MVIRARLWSAGKLLLLVAALGATFLLSGMLAMRVAVRSREVEVPNLTGIPLAEATQIADAAGLTLRVADTRRTDTPIAVDHVAQQEPPNGTRTRRQRTIRVWLSAGARSTTVPLLVGETEQAARRHLEQEGLATEVVTEFRSLDYPTDAVAAQAPPPAATSSTVAILVNRGEAAATYVTPDLIGFDGQQAADALRARGFRVAIVGEESYPGIPVGTVVRQQPTGGFRMGPSDAISLEVSR